MPQVAPGALWQGVALDMWLGRRFQSAPFGTIGTIGDPDWHREPRHVAGRAQAVKLHRVLQFSHI